MSTNWPFAISALCQESRLSIIVAFIDNGCCIQERKREQDRAKKIRTLLHKILKVKWTLTNEFSLVLLEIIVCQLLRREWHRLKSDFKRYVKQFKSSCKLLFFYFYFIFFGREPGIWGQVLQECPMEGQILNRQNCGSLYRISTREVLLSQILLLGLPNKTAFK